MITLSTIKAEAIKRFDEKFPELWDSCDGREGYAGEIQDEVKHFLSQEIDRAVEAVVKVIEDTKKNVPPYPVEEGVTGGRNEAMRDGAKLGYFDALNDLLQKLSTLKEK